MGANESKLSVCHYCATEIIAPPPPKESSKKDKLKENQTDFYSSGDEKAASSISDKSSSSLINKFEIPINTLCCTRCHGFYKLPTPNSSSSDLKNKDLKRSSKINNKRYIEYCHIAPFDDTLLYSEEKEMDQQYVINSYLIPYFNKNKNMIIRSPYRFKVKNVEFKILSCYPPKGMVSGDTIFHLDDKNGNLIKLRFEPIKQIHLLPLKSSIITYKKVNNLPIDDDDENKEEKKNDNHNTEPRDYSNKDLLRLSLKPYLKGNDKLLYIKPKKKKKTKKASKDVDQPKDKEHKEE